MPQAISQKGITFMRKHAYNLLAAVALALVLSFVSCGLGGSNKNDGGDSAEMTGSAETMASATPVWAAGDKNGGGDSAGAMASARPVWAAVATGDRYSLAIKTDGSLWAWGRNVGQLGFGDRKDRKFPTRVSKDSDWAAVAAGDNHNLAIKTDGSLWAWGKNGDGQLGLGHSDDRKFPVRVGKDNDWKAVAAGHGHSLAVKTDGSLWAWGKNGDDQLGLGHSNDRKYPTRVSAGSPPLAPAGAAPAK